MLRSLLWRQQEFLDRHDPVQELIVSAPHPPQAAFPTGSPNTYRPPTRVPASPGIEVILEEQLASRPTAAH